MPVVGDRLDREHRDRLRAGPARSAPRAAGARSASSRCRHGPLIASAWTPRRSARRRGRVASSPVIRHSACSSACWTDGPWSCRCQPMNGPPSYSTVSRQRVMRGSCPAGIGEAAQQLVRRSSRPCRRAGRRVGRSAPSPQAMVSWSSSTSPGCAARLDALGREQLDPLALDLEPGAGEGSEGPDLALDLGRRPRPVDPRLGLVDLGGVGDAVLGLRHRRRSAAGRPAPRPSVARRVSPSSSVSCAGILVVDRDLALEQHRPGVEPCLHLHDGHAGHLVAGQDRALDRRRAAPARQQRGVDVEAAELAARRGSAAAGSAHRPRPPRHRRRARRMPPAPPRSRSDRGRAHLDPQLLGAHLRPAVGRSRLAAPGRARRLAYRPRRPHAPPRPARRASARRSPGCP